MESNVIESPKKNTAPRNRSAALTAEILESLKEFKNDIPKHSYFNPEFGDIDFTLYYANNEIHSLELRFSVPASEWNELRTSPFFQELVSEIRSYRHRIPDTHTDYYAQECKEETEPYDESSRHQGFFVSLWARVRKLFRKH